MVKLASGQRKRFLWGFCAFLRETLAGGQAPKPCTVFGAIEQGFARLLSRGKRERQPRTVDPLTIHSRGSEGHEQLSAP